MKHPLKSPTGQTLKMYTILIWHTMLQPVLFDVHTSISYTAQGALAATQAFYPEQVKSSEYFFEIKKVLEASEFIKMFQENVDDQVFSKTKISFVRQPKYATEDAAKFVGKLIEAAPAMVENETEARILSFGLTKIKKLYDNNP